MKNNTGFRCGVISHFVNSMKGYDKLIAGYVRLSRDDDKKNYVSIENQKLIIEQYAKNKGMVINRWYEDDSISGYKFDRPGFSQLMEDLENDIDIIISKDLSRIGRHNAKVLLLLDYIKERGKRLLLVDDNYDTYDDNDDIIGIKTWYNERYVKDASKKIKRVLNARQKEGTLLIGVPFGYIRNPLNKKIIEVVEGEARNVKLIYELYLQGFGYRKIANLLSEKEIPTPSMVLRERYIKEGKIYRRTVTKRWSDSMVADILKNDFYIGNLRLHKRERIMINGTDHRVSRENQLVFQENHDGIIDEKTFHLVQETMKKRANINYRGQKHKFSGITNGNKHIFAGYLYCKDCGNSLTSITRGNKYYICNTYNSKGKHYCAYSHLIEEQSLINDIINYFILCRTLLNSDISSYNLKKIKQDTDLIDNKRKSLIESINKKKNHLKIIVTQKINDLSINRISDPLILETYNSIQNEIMDKIREYENQLSELEKILDNKEIAEEIENKFRVEKPLEILNRIITNKNINSKDIETLIEKIVVNKNGMPEIYLKYGLYDLIKNRYDCNKNQDDYNKKQDDCEKNQNEYNKNLNNLIETVLNESHNEIVITIMKLIYNDNRAFTSVKFLFMELNRIGFKISKKSLIPYILYMENIGVLQKSDNNLKPYDVIISREELLYRINSYIDAKANGWYA